MRIYPKAEYQSYIVALRGKKGIITNLYIYNVHYYRSAQAEGASKLTSNSTQGARLNLNSDPWQMPIDKTKLS